MNIFKRIGKILFYFLLTLVVLILVFVAVAVKLVNRTPVQNSQAYETMMSRLDTAKIKFKKPVHSVSVGFSKVNLTPPFKTSTAGYGKRLGKLYSEVHDSVFVRTIVVDNGSIKVAVVSADLLMIPPTVARSLQEKLPSIGFSLENTFLGATHTHNSLGNWGEGAARFLYGSYDEKVVAFIADAIVESISKANSNVLEAEMRTGKIPVGGAVRNRVVKNGQVDPNLRVISFQRTDSVKLLLMNYTAHATCLFAKDLSLSRDYPGKLVDTMERKYCDFAMFMAGAVGSHGCHSPQAGYDCIDWMAEQISNGFLAADDKLNVVKDSIIAMSRVPLALADPQIKLTKDIATRPWFFRAAFGEYPAYITNLRLGNMILLGTPCDFSGEFDPLLDSLAQSRGLDVMVSSFNGGYIGYITPTSYFDIDHYETRLLNWYPPGTGEYIRDCLAKMIVLDSNTKISNE